jgi:hypothetical protein
MPLPLKVSFMEHDMTPHHDSHGIINECGQNEISVTGILKDKKAPLPFPSHQYIL